jgi:uncharacterized protein with HEPN domain
MSERNLSLLLRDIHTSITRILEYTDGISFEAYVADHKTVDAVTRNFEIIGEAASRIPEEFKKLHPHIEWRVIKDFRNFMIHEYFGIDDLIVWDTIQKRLPDLLVKISALLGEI